MPKRNTMSQTREFLSPVEMTPSIRSGSSSSSKLIVKPKKLARYLSDRQSTATNSSSSSSGIAPLLDGDYVLSARSDILEKVDHHYEAILLVLSHRSLLVSLALINRIDKAITLETRTQLFEDISRLSAIPDKTLILMAVKALLQAKHLQILLKNCPLQTVRLQSLNTEHKCEDADYMQRLCIALCAWETDLMKQINNFVISKSISTPPLLEPISVLDLKIHALHLDLPSDEISDEELVFESQPTVVDKPVIHEEERITIKPVPAPKNIDITPLAIQTIIPDLNAPPLHISRDTSSCPSETNSLYAPKGRHDRLMTLIQSESSLDETFPQQLFQPRQYSSQYISSKAAGKSKSLVRYGEIDSLRFPFAPEPTEKKISTISRPPSPLLNASRPKYYENILLAIRHILPILEGNPKFHGELIDILNDTHDEHLHKLHLIIELCESYSLQALSPSVKKSERFSCGFFACRSGNNKVIPQPADKLKEFQYIMGEINTKEMDNEKARHISNNLRGLKEVSFGAKFAY